MGGIDRNGKSRKVGRILIAVAVAAVVALAWLAPKLGWSPARQPKLVVLYCYSTLDEVMQEALLPAFRAHWQEEHGEEVEFVTTFAGSGEITDRILDRYPAEVAIVSSELDAYRLPVPWKSWKELPHQGVLARTPLVIVVREGNPKAIHRFEGLSRTGIDLIHGDPLSSGLGNLAILAEYGSGLRRTGDQEIAFNQLLGIWRNAAVLLPDARQVHRHFDTGAGDVFIAYEQDAVGGPSNGPIRGEIVFPPSTIVGEPIVARIDKNITSKQQPLIEAFVSYLWSREAQKILVDYGFRSVNEDLNASSLYLDFEDAFTLEDLGGATTARREILEGVWKDKVLPALGR